MGRQEHAAVSREYGRLASRYDRRWASYVQASVDETVRRLPADPGRHLLDVACGTGVLLAVVTAAWPDTRPAGIDISPAMLEVARRRLPADVLLLSASAESLPFPDESFDTVVSTNALHFFRSPETALAEMMRVLRPSGHVVITDWCDDFLTCRLCDRFLRLFSAAHRRIYGRSECRALVERAGLAVLDLQHYKINWFWGLMTVRARKLT